MHRLKLLGQREGALGVEFRALGCGVLDSGFRLKVLGFGFRVSHGAVRWC